MGHRSGRCQIKEGAAEVRDIPLTARGKTGDGATQPKEQHMKRLLGLLLGMVGGARGLLSDAVAVSPDDVAEIHCQLTQLEVEHDVSVLDACELGRINA